MPIQIQEPDSLSTIEEKLRAFENKYGISSESFACNPSYEGHVPEFAAIEWSFLLMQKRAMLEDDNMPSVSWRRTSEIERIVDVRESYELVAA